jgi:alpha,alpha-trehalose phosphorylase
MIHHERLRPPSHDYPADEWNVVESGFHPEFMAQLETMLALGNGYLGMRGCPEEGGPYVENSTLINGFYEIRPILYPEEAYGFAKTGQTIFSVTDSKIIKLFVDDEPFWLPNANLLRCERRLNMKAGTLDREILWETPTGKQVLITSRRLVSFASKHVAAISYTVTLLNAPAAVLISSEMVAEQPSVRTDGNDPRQTRGFAGRLLHPKASKAQDRRIVLCHTTEKSQLTLACGVDHTLETSCAHGYKAAHTPDFGQVAFTVEAEPGCPIHLTKWMVYHTSSTASSDELRGRAEWTLDRVVHQGFPQLLASQEQYMADFWQRSDVQIKDSREARTKRSTLEIQQAIRFNLFHILQASARAEYTGVSAKGLTGQAYEGHYFWDTEIYVLPFLTYTSPRIAKNLLTFRYKMLEQARARARQLGHRGAMFPWRTINGEEASAYYAAGTAQYHINADIMYALRKYVQATGDEAFLRDYGAEMLVETARLWSDLGFYSETKGGRFCINAVTGPDEYNTVVNNNAYTNLMARENLRYAAETVEALRATAPDAYGTLVRRTALEPSEVKAWMRAAERMYVPYDEKLRIVPQDDDFLDREPWDFKNTPADRYPLLLFHHPLNIYRKRVVKQTDVVLAMFLLGDEFSPEEKKRNFEFYDPLTTGDSSLSSCVEAIVAAQIGDTDKAIRYGMAALLMDLADVGGNVKDGCHIASMGGTWMMLAYGLAGIRDDDGTLSFWPRRAPEDNATLRFPVTYRGQMLQIEIGTEEVAYTLARGDRLVIRHETEEIELTPAHPLAVRPVSRRSGKDHRTAPRSPSSAARKVLVIDVGGTAVKILATGQTESRSFLSGPTLTPGRMVSEVKKLAADWTYDVVSIGYPGPVVHDRPLAEPHNLGRGWIGFDYARAFGLPVKIINDAAMQALGSYEGGKMLFLGLGTGLGSALIVDGIVAPMEIAHLPYKDGTYEDYLGRAGLERYGEKEWSRHVADAVKRLVDALQPHHTVIGGGNVRRLAALPPNCRPGDNANAFNGGFELWAEGSPVAEQPSGRASAPWT